MLTHKLRLAATSLFLFVGLTTMLFGALPAQTVFADHEPGHSATEEGTLNTGENTAESDGCLSANPLSWFGCGVLALIDEALDWLNTTINSLLFIDPLPENIEKSWAIFRNLAYIILVPMMLLMVIGTAINMGPFDPYTVKKALPRMFIAVIFIALSLPICSFFVNISNVLGNGAGNIITSLSGIDQLTDTEGAGTNTSGIIGAGVLYGLTGGITWGIVGSLGLVMVVGLLIGFFTLVLRQVLVVMLIILAPLAILVWIFPGNDKLWGVWRATFTAMLLLYPLVAILIASGKFFAATVLETGIGGNQGTVSQLVAMTAYVAPFFMIPAAFKYGMGIFGNLAGMVNDRGRGLFDKQSQYRQAKRAQGWQDFKSGSGRGRLRQTAFVRGAGERVAGGVKGNIGPNATAIRAARWDSAAGNAAADYMKSAEFQAQSENDPLLRAAAAGTTRAESVRNLQSLYGISAADAEKHAAQAEATLGFGRKQQVAAAQQLVNTGTGYDNIEQMSKTLAIAAGGNEETASRLAGYANFAAKQKGRYDLAPGFSKADSLVKADMKPGGASLADYHAATVAGARGADAVTLLRGKPGQVKQLTQSLADHADANRRIMNSTDPSITDAQRSTARDEFVQTMGQIDQLNQSKSYASPENQEHVNRLLNDTRNLRTQELDAVLGRTYDNSGRRTDIIEGPNGAPIPGPSVTQQQIEARERYNQVQSPRYNPNDPNSAQ